MPVDFLRDARFVARASVSRSDRLVRCSCNPGWKGPDCGTLDLLPVSDNLEDSAAYGTFPSSTTTGLAAWGGSVLPDPSNGSLYHGFFAEMALDCGLTAWYRNSMVVHATASTPTGPFTRQDLILNYFARGYPPFARFTASLCGMLWWLSLSVECKRSIAATEAELPAGLSR